MVCVFILVTTAKVISKHSLIARDKRSLLAQDQTHYWDSHETHYATIWRYRGSTIKNN